MPALRPALENLVRSFGAKRCALIIADSRRVALVAATGLTPRQLKELRAAQAGGGSDQPPIVITASAGPVRTTARRGSAWRVAFGDRPWLIPIGEANVHEFVVLPTGVRRIELSDPVRLLLGQLSLAMENGALSRQIDQHERVVQSIVRSTIEAQEEERKRVAAEIHDSLTQQLIAIWYRVHACESMLESDRDGARQELSLIKARIDETLADCRLVLQNLRPTTLDDLGLVAALRSLAARFEEDTGAAARVHLEGEIALAKHYELSVYRIVQEALTNAHVHGHATLVDVRLSGDGEWLTVEVKDNGRGFLPQARMTAGDSQPHYGLAGMKERAQLLSGRFSLRSAPGRGTTIRVQVPLRAARAPAAGDGKAG